MEWVGWVLGLGFVAVLLFFAVRKMMSDNAADKVEGVTDTLEIPGGPTLRLTRTELIEGYENGGRHPIAGLVARVEEGGNVNRRYTVTRIATLGVFAAGLPKKIDDRQLYLTIEGPKTVVVHEIPIKKAPQIGVRARAFAAKINQMAGEFPPSMSESMSRVEPKREAQAPESVAAKIRELAQLRAEGLLTEAEYEAKRAELLSRY